MDFRILNLLFRCSKEFSHDRTRLKDLTDTECMICSYICAHPDRSQEETASALGIEKTTAAKAIASLERKNCIERTTDAADRRKKRLRMTETGCGKVSGLMNIHNEWLAEVLTCLSPDEQKRFEAYCERLLAAAEALGEKKNKTEEIRHA